MGTLARRILNGQSLDGMAGVRTQTSISAEYRLGTFTNAPMVMEMDALPNPSLHRFFEQFDTSRFA